MTAWAPEPCDWPDDPQQLELDLAAAEQAFLDLHGSQPAAYRDITTVTLIGDLL